MDIRNFFGAGKVFSTNIKATPQDQKKPQTKIDNPPLEKKGISRNVKPSSSKIKKSEPKTITKQISTASQHISDIDDDDFPEFESKKVKKNSPNKYKSIELKSSKTKRNDETAVTKTTTNSSSKASSSNSNEMSVNKISNINSKVLDKGKTGLKRQHESDDDDDIQTTNKRSKKIASDSEEDPLPASLRGKKAITSSSSASAAASKFDENFKKVKEAFTRVKEAGTRVEVAGTRVKAAHSSITQPSEKKKKMLIDPSDFFGSLPVHMNERKNIESNKATKHFVDIEEHSNGSLGLSTKLSNKKKRDENKNDDDLIEEIKEPMKKKQLLETDTPLDEAVDSGRDLKKENNGEFQSPAPKRKPDVDSPARSVKKDEDRRKSYLAFVNREPPKALGSKEIPEGAENCLEGLTFVLTGIYESIDRDDCKSLIEKHGGKVTTNVSRNTKFLVVGRDAGASKITKAIELKTKQIDEDSLFELLRNLPAKKSKYEIEAEKGSSKKPKKSPTSVSSTAIKLKVNKAPSCDDDVVAMTSETSTTTTLLLSSSLSSSSLPQQLPLTKAKPETSSKNSELKIAANEGKTLLWVDKYKPTSIKNIIGQQGDKSQAKKLHHWLLNWHKNINKKPITGRPSEDGCGFKAALLSGPPGIGKTTTAHLVCQETGFSFFELNASDTRSKKSLKEVVSEALNSHSLFGFFNDGNQSGTLDGKKHCLVMDEVDGMSGNEDRGGVQEVIQLIKTSHIPIICMCNDRNNTKIRSLSNYCFDLRFQRPRVEQIKGSMMSIAFKEGIKIPAPALNEIIQAANQDIRQVIHNLSMWSVKDKNLTYDQLKEDAAKAQKDLHYSPFDVCRKVFSGSDDNNKKMTLNDKSDLFFHDYSIAPLFVQENYLAIRPYNAQAESSKHLSLLAQAASSMSMGDLVDGRVRKYQQWGLLPTQAMFASVIPGEKMRGAMSGMIAFPSWLGKNSTTKKNNRLIQELVLHTSLNASCGKQSLNLDYLPAMKHLLTSPLITEGSEGVERTVTIMNDYSLLREDFDNILDLTTWSGEKDVMSKIDSKVKASFTRSYNKEGHMLPYSNIVVKKKRGVGVSQGDDDGDYHGDEEGAMNGEDVEEVNEEANDITADAMIKVKKPSKSRSTEAKKSSSKETTTQPKKPRQTQKKPKKTQ